MYFLKKLFFVTDSLDIRYAPTSRARSIRDNTLKKPIVVPVKEEIALAPQAGPYHPHPGNLSQKKGKTPATKTEASFEVLSIFPTKY